MAFTASAEVGDLIKTDEGVKLEKATVAAAVV